MTKQIIIIIGFMGTGKSTVARELARTLNRQMVDLDELITAHEGRSPGEIIEEDGESAFREIESQRLVEALLAGAAGIMSVGGGAWTMPENRRAIADHGAFTVWLDAPFELCWRRIEAGAETRPLAPSREAAEQLYRERLGLYQLADLRIRIAEEDSAAAVAAKIVRSLSLPE